MQVGFWRSQNEPHLPMPEPGVLSADEANAIHDLIKMREKECEAAYEQWASGSEGNDFGMRGDHSVGMSQYRGLAPSRITGEPVGAAEYFHSDFTWPAGYASHYVRDHKVKPPQEFLKFIGYEGA